MGVAERDAGGRRASARRWVVEAGGVAVEVERRSVRRLNLRVRADGTAHLSIPERASLLEARDFLRAHEGWLRRHAAPSAGRGTGPAPAFGTGPALGDGRVALWGAPAPLPEGVAPDELFRRELAARLPGVVARMEAATGLHARGWQLRAMTSRWGSCTPGTARMRLNVRLAAFPPECLDCVVAHELTHLVEPGHGERFHRLLARVVPNEREVKALLRRDPAELAAERAGRAAPGGAGPAGRVGAAGSDAAEPGGAGDGGSGDACPGGTGDGGAADGPAGGYAGASVGVSPVNGASATDAPDEGRGAAPVC